MTESRRTGRGVWAPIVWAVLIFLSVGVLQLSDGSYQSDLASHPDEAAHFVTATCLLDYVKTAFGTNPVRFAESYYVRYPRVAFGHWPPGFFGVQALWYWMVGASAPTAILLVGLIAALGGLALFFAIRHLFGTRIALLSYSVFLFLPLFQRSTSVLMADLLGSVFSFLAMLAFCGTLTSRSRRFRVAAVLWTAMAILTKESALPLLVFAPAALILSGETRAALKRTWPMWVGLCLLIPLLLAIYVVSGVLQLRGLPTFAGSPATPERLRFLLLFRQSAPLALFVIAAVGALGSVAIKREPNRERDVYVRGAILWLSILLASQVLFRDVVEPRYFLPAVFPLMILFAAGLDRLSRWTVSLIGTRPGGPRWLAPAFGGLLVALLSVFCVATMPSNPRRHRSGYAQLAASLPVGPGSVVLVSSDSSGEGALIVERLVRDDARRGVVLRASKTLSSSDWMGGNYQPAVTTVQEVRDLLNSIPVHFIVIDMNGFISEPDRPHHQLLEQTMKEESGQFRLIGDFPLFFGSRRRDGAMQVYENLEARGRRPDVIQVLMSETLGRKLEVRLDDRGAEKSRVRTVSGRGIATGLWIWNAAGRLRALLPSSFLRE